MHVVLSIGLSLFVSTLFAQQPDSLRNRFFLEVNTSFRRANPAQFNEYFEFVKYPIKNVAEFSGYLGRTVGKKEKGFLRIGYHCNPLMLRQDKWTHAQYYEKDSIRESDISTVNSVSRFQFQSFTFEGGYFYKLHGFTTEIGLGLSLNKLTWQQTFEYVQFGEGYRGSEMLYSYNHRSETTWGPFANWGGGALAYGGISYPVSDHLSFTGNLRFYLAAIRLRVKDGKPVWGKYVPTPLGGYKEKVYVTLSGLSAGVGLRYMM
jgi:hypothetical protein